MTSAAPAERRERQGRHARNRWLIGAVMLLITGWLGWHLGSNQQSIAGEPSAGPTITQIRELADLVTAKVTIADARETTLSGYLGDVKALLVVRGDALLGPDLSRAKIVSCDSATKVMVIELPRPRVISYRLDHSATRLACLSHDGLWMIVPGDAGRTAVLNRAYAEAERAVAEAADTTDTINQAAENAQRTLAAFLGSDGWTVRVRWAD